MRAENIEFIALFQASQWSAAEAARRLKTTRASISRYLNPDPKKQMTPSGPVLELFKFILASEQPEKLTAVSALREESMADWEREMLSKLRWLHKEDRERVLTAMRAIISALPKRAAVDYSKTASSANAAGVAANIVGKVREHVSGKNEQNEGGAGSTPSGQQPRGTVRRKGKQGTSPAPHQGQGS